MDTGSFTILLPNLTVVTVLLYIINCKISFTTHWGAFCTCVNATFKKVYMPFGTPRPSFSRGLLGYAHWISRYRMCAWWTYQGSRFCPYRSAILDVAYIVFITKNPEASSFCLYTSDILLLTGYRSTHSICNNSMGMPYQKIKILQAPGAHFWQFSLYNDDDNNNNYYYYYYYYYHHAFGEKIM